MREHGTIQKVSPRKCVIVGVGSSAPKVSSRYGGDPGPRHLEASQRREPKEDHPMISTTCILSYNFMCVGCSASLWNDETTAVTVSQRCRSRLYFNVSYSAFYLRNVTERKLNDPI